MNGLERGDLVWLDFDPQAGHEQAGQRPALVLTPSEYNSKVGLALFCPVTTKARGYPFEVALPPGQEIEGVVLADQVKSLDWRKRKPRRAGRVPEAVVSEVLGKLGTLLSGS